jgi:hypothetical protein
MSPCGPVHRHSRRGLPFHQTLEEVSMTTR